MSPLGRGYLSNPPGEQRRGGVAMKQVPSLVAGQLRKLVINMRRRVVTLLRAAERLAIIRDVAISQRRIPHDEVSRPHFYCPPLPTMMPAGFLTNTAYSRLGLSSLRMVPYHSTPPLKKKTKKNFTERQLPNSPPSPPLSPVERKKGGRGRGRRERHRLLAGLADPETTSIC